MDITEKLEVIITELKAARTELNACMAELNAAMVEKHSQHVSEYFKRKAFGDDYKQFMWTVDELIQNANDAHADNKSKGWTND
jgi:hypothetical protein